MRPYHFFSEHLIAGNETMPDPSDPKNLVDN